MTPYLPVHGEFANTGIIWDQNMLHLTTIFMYINIFIAFYSYLCYHSEHCIGAAFGPGEAGQMCRSGHWLISCSVLLVPVLYGGLGIDSVEYGKRSTIGPELT